jgi:excinuclease UvrABC ATPase subunit
MGVWAYERGEERTSWARRWRPLDSARSQSLLNSSVAALAAVSITPQRQRARSSATYENLQRQTDRSRKTVRSGRTRQRSTRKCSHSCNESADGRRLANELLNNVIKTNWNTSVKYQSINFQQKFGLLAEHWAPQGHRRNERLSIQSCEANGGLHLARS